MLNESMPHQIVEYSQNLAPLLDIQSLVRVLHQRAAAIQELPLAGLRTRAYAATHYMIADDHPDNAFIAVYLRVGQGRDEATRQAIGRALYECLCEHTADLFAKRPLALSYEVQEIVTATRWNKANLRDYLEQRKA